MPSPRSRSALFSLLLAGLLLTPAGLSAVPGATAAEQPSTAITVSLDRSVAVPLRQVREMVTEFERYAQDVPIVQGVEVVAREPGSTLVRFRYRIVRAGDFVLERRFVDRGERRVDFDSEAGTLGRLTGSWLLSPDPEDATHTRVRYEASLEPGFDAPAFLIRYVLKNEAPNLLDALVAAVPAA